eukprot:11272535-Heterocapsa_arctica.AAC.1
MIWRCTCSTMRTPSTWRHAVWRLDQGSHIAINVLDAFAKGYWRIAGATSSTRGEPRRRSSRRGEA